MDIVCASPCASQYGSVRSLRRSFASGWTEPSAFYGERVRDIVLGNEVVAAFGFGFSFWLHQGRIPHRFCRFYLLLAGAVGKRQGISIPYPSPTPLLTPLGIRCGGAFWLPRLTGIQDSCIRCRFLIPTSIYRLGALCSG